MSTFPDIYTLTDNGIRILLTPQLKNELNKFINNNPNSLKNLSKSLNIDYTTLWDYLNRRTSIPLIFFFNIKQKYNKDFSKHFEYFEYGYYKKKTKVVKKLTEDLAKVLGAHVADGNLRIRKTKFKNNKEAKHYELVLREEFETNIIAFLRWFNNVFDFNLNYKKDKNHFYIYVSNKLILYYFNKLFEIPLGRKTETIKIPDVIKNSDKNIKKSFLQGLFMFDGSVEYTTGYVSLVSRSKQLIQDVNKILNEINLKPDYISKKEDNFKRHRIIIRKKEKLKKCLILFEKNTEKWYRLHEHLYGFKKFNNNKQDLIKEFEKYYPNKRESALSFSIILKNIPKKEFDLYWLINKLNRKRTMVHAYLHKLETWKILNSKYKQKGKIYKLNKNLPKIRRQ